MIGVSERPTPIRRRRQLRMVEVEQSEALARMEIRQREWQQFQFYEDDYVRFTYWMRRM